MVILTISNQPKWCYKSGTCRWFYGQKWFSETVDTWCFFPGWEIVGCTLVGERDWFFVIFTEDNMNVYDIHILINRFRTLVALGFSQLSFPRKQTQKKGGSDRWVLRMLGNKKILVGGFKHYLFSVSYMGCQPSHCHWPLSFIFFKMVIAPPGSNMRIFTADELMGFWPTLRYSWEQRELVSR